MSYGDKISLPLTTLFLAVEGAPLKPKVGNTETIIN
jgi:hypothetical protein